MQFDRDQNKFKYRIVVGEYGDYKTIKEAVDWFNASATQDTTIALDSDNFSITDTITVNNSSYSLQIIGMESTRLEAATGLTSKPMFNIKTDCDIRCIVADGSTLASYGTLTNEDFVQYTTTASYSELTDIIITNFKIGVHDTIGTDIFMMNYIVSDCPTGCETNYTTSPGWTTMKEFELGTYDNCTNSIKLTKAASENFIFGHIYFVNQTGQNCIYYSGGNYVPNGICNIIGCSYNNVGTFSTGFDFARADGRDANIEIFSCVGKEDKAPHCKVNVVDSTATTTATTAGTYYKVNFNSKKLINFDQAATSGNFTITIGDQTTVSLAWNASAATIQTAINNLSNVTSVTVTQLTAAKTWTIEFLTTGEGWLGMMPVVNLGTLSPTTSAEVTPDNYSCKWAITNNKYTLLTDHKQDLTVWLAGAITIDSSGRTVTLGIKKNGTGMPLGPNSTRIATGGTPVPFATIVYLEDMVKNDFFEIWASTLNNGDTITLSDLTMFVQAQ